VFHAGVLHLLLAGVGVRVERDVLSGTASGVAAFAFTPGVVAAPGCGGRSAPFARAAPAWRRVDRPVVVLNFLGFAFDRRVQLVAGVERFALRLRFHQRVLVGRTLLANDFADALAELDDLGLGSGCESSIAIRSACACALASASG
jgi:hypothetical protein